MGGDHSRCLPADTRSEAVQYILPCSYPTQSASPIRPVSSVMSEIYDRLGMPSPVGSNSHSGAGRLRVVPVPGSTEASASTSQSQAMAASSAQGVCSQLPQMVPASAPNLLPLLPYFNCLNGSYWFSISLLSLLCFTSQP